MNNSEVFNFQNMSSMDLAIGGVVGCSVLIYVVSMLITFPLYVYVHRINKKTDKLAYFYPITKHFYTVICSMQFYMYVTIFVFFITWILFDLTRGASVFLFSFGFGYLIGVAVTSVQNVLLFVLALRRFLIFFVPNFQKMISINPKTFNIVLKLLYIFYIVIQVFTKIFKLGCTSSTMISSGLFSMRNSSDPMAHNMTMDKERAQGFRDEYNSCSDQVDNIYMRIYLAGDFFVMLAAVLYGIMFVKIRRWSKMTGDPLNHPERYIFYQTLLIVMTKLLAIIMIVFCILGGGYTVESAFGIFVVTDITTTPLVIQCSYLLCNRANVDAVLAIQFRKMRTWLVLLCGEEPGRRPRRRRNAAARYKEAKKKVKNLISKKTVVQQRDVAVVEPTVIVIQPEFLNRRRSTMQVQMYPGVTPLATGLSNAS